MTNSTDNLHILFILVFIQPISRKLHLHQAGQVIAVHIAFGIRPRQSGPAVFLIFNNNHVRAAVNAPAGHRERIGRVATASTVFFQQRTAQKRAWRRGAHIKRHLRLIIPAVIAGDFIHANKTTHNGLLKAHLVSFTFPADLCRQLRKTHGIFHLYMQVLTVFRGWQTRLLFDHFDTRRGAVPRLVVRPSGNIRCRCLG